MTSFHTAVDIGAFAIVAGAFFVAFIYPPLSMRKATRQSCIALARAVEAREPFLLGHSELTAHYAVAMAKQSLRLWPWQVRDLEVASLLHLVGKVGVPHAILNSAYPLDRADQFSVREYVRIGAQIIHAVPLLSAASRTVQFHREYLDGSGHPFGRYGDGVPFSSRILCVATEYVSMTRPRLYRGTERAMTHEEALAHFLDYSGTRYDPEVIELLARAVRPSRMGIVARFLKVPGNAVTAAD